MAQETILIVDDSSEFAGALDKYMLTPLNYKTLHAANGQVGLKMATSYNPDLILLDMNMPRMTGLEMLAALRQTKCNAPVIFMTAEGSEEVAVEAFRLGVRDYLAKPFSSDDLQSAVDHALQETRLKREKEKLKRELIVSETIRQTIVTLSHYLNNYLAVLNGNIFLLEEEIPNLSGEPSIDLSQIVRDCQGSTAKIEAVLRILQRVTNAQKTSYHGQVKMVDIEAALRKELGEL